jgi:hypothetical protein
MNAKLTLSLDQTVIERAKEYAKERQISLSKMVEELLFAVTHEPAEQSQKKLSPVDELMGMLEDPGPEFDYKQARYEYLKKKYGL